MASSKLLAAVIALTVGDAVGLNTKGLTVQATVTGTGALTATIKVQVCNDPALGWIDKGTITLAGNDNVTDAVALTDVWAFVRANLTVLTGTGATVTATMNV